jgi:hypothetical protein
VLANLTFREAASTDLPLIVSMLADDDLGRLRESPGIPLEQAYIDALHAIIW